jgi:hypothetical protein
MTLRLHADFNGLSGDLLCLTHGDTATSESGEEIQLREGMEVVAFEPDEDEGLPVFLVARGRVAPSPPALACRGSRWCLKIDEQGWRHVAALYQA